MTLQVHATWHAQMPLGVGQPNSMRITLHERLRSDGSEAAALRGLEKLSGCDAVINPVW